MTRLQLLKACQDRFGYIILSNVRDVESGVGFYSREGLTPLPWKNIGTASAEEWERVHLFMGDKREAVWNGVRKVVVDFSSLESQDFNLEALTVNKETIHDDQTESGRDTEGVGILHSGVC